MVRWKRSCRFSWITVPRYAEKFNLCWTIYLLRTFNIGEFRGNKKTKFAKVWRFRHRFLAPKVSRHFWVKDVCPSSSPNLPSSFICFSTTATTFCYLNFESLDVSLSNKKVKEAKKLNNYETKDFDAIFLANFEFSRVTIISVPRRLIIIFSKLI